jgi:hypothetical protein
VGWKFVGLLTFRKAYRIREEHRAKDYDYR